MNYWLYSTVNEFRLNWFLNVYSISNAVHWSAASDYTAKLQFCGPAAGQWGSNGIRCCHPSRSEQWIDSAVVGAIISSPPRFLWPHFVLPYLSWVSIIVNFNNWIGNEHLNLINLILVFYNFHICIFFSIHSIIQSFHFRPLFEIKTQRIIT